MNKEKIITISIGLLVGVLAAGGYFLAIKFLPALQKPRDQIVVSPNPKNQSSENSGNVSAVASVQLTLDQPADHSSTSEAELVISGQTVPGATIILFGNSDEQIASADAVGKFSDTLKLEEGENEISATAFLNKINSPVVHRNVTLEVSQ